MSVIILAFFLFIISFILTAGIKYYAHHHHILDIPNERSSHVVPTPKGGGLAIILSWYLGITIMFISHSLDKQLYFTFLSGILLAAVSIIDDLFDIKPYIRLLIQALTAVLALIFMKGINQVEFLGIAITSKLIIYPLVIIGMIWFINLFNFLDGIDGYASLEAISIAIALFILTSDLTCIVLVASVLGFFIWNWPRAKIFMGDIGSTQLGFILFVFALSFHNNATLSITHWIMLTSVFWFDATLTLYRRWRNKENLTKAHKKHAYQRLVQSGVSHAKTDLLLLLVNLMIFGLVLISIKNVSFLIPAFIVNIIFLYGITRLIDRSTPFATR